MQLNIKDPETYRLAKRLAELRKQPVARVVRDAVKRELDEAEGEIERRVQAVLADLKGVAEELRAAEIEKFGRVLTKEEWDDMLYDENGLPH
jgi:hypothetical protein